MASTDEGGGEITSGKGGLGFGLKRQGTSVVHIKGALDSLRGVQEKMQFHFPNVFGDEEFDEQLHELATKLQAVWRGKATRKKYNMKLKLHLIACAHVRRISMAIVACGCVV